MLGTAVDMVLANVAAVLSGDRLANRLPVRAIRTAAAVLFAGLGVLRVVQPR